MYVCISLQWYTLSKSYFISVLMQTKELRSYLSNWMHHQRHVIEKAVLLKYILYHGDVEK